MTTTRVPERLLNDRITIRRPVQTFSPGTKQPVFEYQLAAEHVKARFNPLNTDLKVEGGVIGRVPKKRFKLYLNSAELKENYEVVNEATGQVYLVMETRNYFGHHVEAEIEEKKQ